MHGEDPVDWLDWQPNTLEKATQENKIIMISSGYFSCHWCHVMQRENYHDVETAKFLNQHFISVKIDRELTPDLDRYLIDFAQRASGHAGWPQHVFLTPDGYPFFAFTYQPKPDFLNSLKRIIELWNTSEDRIRKASINAVPKPYQPKSEPFTLTASKFYNKLQQQISPQLDTLSGGLKRANKFPSAPLLQALLDAPDLSEENLDWLLLTLDQMQSEHLIDHVNHGFYRYTVDPEWQTPHFEKMLYTQALLAKIYFQAGQKYNRPDYIQTALNTLSYAQNHLFNSNIGLYQGSQSAIDKHNLEGGDYLWSKAQLQQKLTANEFKIVEKQWQLDRPAPYELNDSGGWHPKPTSQNWASIQQKLLTPPNQIPTDDKSILGWNGLMLSAYAQAQKSAPSQQQTSKGRALAERLITILQAEEPPRALSGSGGKMGRANLQDYAFIIQGLRDWQQIKPSKKNQQAIEEFEETAKKKFLTPYGWQYSDSPALPGQTGEWVLEDDAIPSPTAILDCGNNNHLGRIQGLLNDYPATVASYGTSLTCPKKN